MTPDAHIYDAVRTPRGKGKDTGNLYVVKPLDLLVQVLGALFGLGYAPNTGGPLAWMDRQGLRDLIAEMRSFASKYGERYAPAPILIGMAERGESFWGDFQP